MGTVVGVPSLPIAVNAKRITHLQLRQTADDSDQGVSVATRDADETSESYRQSWNFETPFSREHVIDPKHTREAIAFQYTPGLFIRLVGNVPPGFGTRTTANAWQLDATLHVASIPDAHTTAAAPRQLRTGEALIEYKTRGVIHVVGNDTDTDPDQTPIEDKDESFWEHAAFFRSACFAILLWAEKNMPPTAPVYDHNSSVFKKPRGRLRIKLPPVKDRFKAKSILCGLLDALVVAKKYKFDKLVVDLYPGNNNALSSREDALASMVEMLKREQVLEPDPDSDSETETIN